MALFTKAPPANKVVKAAAGYAYTQSNQGAGQVGNFYSYTAGELRARALRVPTLSRARNLMASVIGGVPLVMYKEMWNGTEMEQVPEAPRTWLRRIDKGVPNNFILAMTFDDLFFYGRCFWLVTEREKTSGYPSNFTRLPAAMITTMDQAGPSYFGPSKQIMFNGLPVDYQDVIQFLSPIDGITTNGAQSINTALKLEQARNRNASVLSPAVTLRQVGGEPLSSQELADLAAAYDTARYASSTCALNEFIELIPGSDPSKMLLIEAADYQAREISRLANVPGYLVSVSLGSYSYVNSREASNDLYAFGVKPYADCIAQTLSADNVLPRGTCVKFDIENWLLDYETDNATDTRSETTMGVIQNA